MDKAEMDLKLATAQLQRAELDNQRLAIELEKLRKPAPWFQVPLQFVPLVTALVSVAGFLWGINLYMVAQQANRDASDRQAQQRVEQARQENVSREREFMQPWLKSQRDIYEEALDAAATATTSRDPKLRGSANDTFWKLYYGRMVLVETTSVSGAMKELGFCLREEGFCTDKQRTDRSLDLASAMALSMAATAKMSYDEFSKNQFLYGRQDFPRVIVK
jgi:hypothetical protein